MTTTIAKPTRIFRLWQKRLDSGVLTKSLCNQFAKSITRQAKGMEPGGFHTAITPDEARALVDRIQEQGGVRLTADDDAKGLEWLKAYGRLPKKRGLGLPDEAITLFSHFSYHGEARFGGYRNTVPVWRINLTDGRKIDYSWAAWTACYFEPGIGYEVKRWDWV